MPSRAPSARGPLAVIFLTVFLDLLGFGMVIPILPLYAEKLHATDAEVGRLLAVYSLMQLFFAPFWGRLSDRLGRRPVLLVSILGSCGSQLGYALAPSYAWLVVARAFAGVCGANIAAASAYVADVTDERSRAGGMGLLGAAFGAGFVLGPAAGGLLSRVDERLPFFAAAGLAALNLLFAVAVLREPSRRTGSRTLTVAGLTRTLSQPRLVMLIALFFIVTFGFANLEATFSLFLARRFAFDRSDTAYLFAFIGVLLVLVQGLVVRRAAPVVGERVLVVGGTLLMAVGMALLCLAHRTSHLVVATAVVSIGNGLNAPSLSALISRAAGREQGSVMGVSQSFGALARIVGPLFGTWVLTWGDAMPYATAGVVIAAACLFATAFVRPPAPGATPLDAPTLE